jgi:hypothetical protein
MEKMFQVPGAEFQVKDAMKLIVDLELGTRDLELRSRIWNIC